MELRDRLFDSISDLVQIPAPSGDEGALDRHLIGRLAALGLEVRRDAGENLIVKIEGSGGGSLALTAHKDEIGATVTAVEQDGRLRVRRLGGSYPWIYGEGVVDLLGEREWVSGILSFGSRHISHASPQSAFKEEKALQWEDVWIETKQSPEALASAGVAVGTRMVVGRHRRAPFRIGDYIASYALDDRASIAILLELATRLQRPAPDVYLVFSAKEEVSASGASYFAQRHPVDAMISVEIAPLAPEYALKGGPDPVLVIEDGNGLYDRSVIGMMADAAAECGVSVQRAVLNTFGSDASIAAKYGNLGRAGCLAFPTENTHGFEITHLGALENCLKVLEAVCRRSMCALIRAETAGCGCSEVAV